MHDIKFAVVKFLDGDSEDDVISEIPIDWIISKNECWWPNTKNIYNLISRGIPPDPNRWQKCRIHIESYCTSIKQARKNANDLHSSSDRRKRRRLDITNDSADESEGSSSSNAESVPSPINNGPPTSTDPKVMQLSSHCSSGASLESNQTVEDVSTQEEARESDVKLFDFAFEVLDGQELHDSAETNYERVLKRLLDENFSVVNNSLTKIHLELRNIKNRICELASVPDSEFSYKDFESVTNILPLSDPKSLLDFENSLADASFNKLFLNYLETIGGNSSKENVIRILKILFSEELAAQMTWCGQRNNIKVSHLAILSTVNASVSRHFSITHKYFEAVCSEWFRLAKQRWKRASKS